MAKLSQDQVLTAAERALGLEPLAGETDEERSEREGWETRFAALHEAIDPVAPPAGLYSTVLSRIATEDAEAEMLSLRRSRTRWRRAALALGALAAGLAGLVVTPLLSPPPARYVAVVYADDDPTVAGMIVQFDVASGTATVIPILSQAPVDQDYQMWQLPVGAERPISVGLLPEAPSIRTEISAEPGDIFAISLEEAGGSPTGQPTQALYHGTVVAVED
ncbi:MAG: anti-sigma factor [Pseudomonadota bacterium]